MNAFEQRPIGNTGLEVDVLGMGCASLGNLYRPVSDAAAAAALTAARERHGFVSPMPFDIVHDYSYDGVMRSYEDSLQRLGLDRIDILFMHDIGATAQYEYPRRLTKSYRGWLPPGAGCPH